MATFKFHRTTKWYNIVVLRIFGLDGVRERLSNCHDAKEAVKLILLLKGDGDAQLKTLFLINNWWHKRNSIREGGQRRPPQV